jgi:hypothetical protein
MGDKSAEEQVTLLSSRELTGTPAGLGDHHGRIPGAGQEGRFPDEVFNLLIRCTTALFETVQLVAREVDELKRPQS